MITKSSPMRFGRAIRLLSLITSSLLAEGCSRVRSGLGFDDVQRAVSERTGLRVEWESGSPEDEEVKAKIASLLNEDLTVEKAMQIALLNSRELRAVYEELNLAQADLVQAGLLQNPILEGAMRFGTGGHGVGVDLGVAQEFISLLYMPLRKAQAGAAFEAAKLRVTGAVLDHSAEVRITFYDLQASEQLREMRESVVEATAASAEFAGLLQAAGNLRDLDAANEQALHEQAKIDLSMAQADVQIQRERLNELMGLIGVQANWRISSRLPSVPAEELPGVDTLEQQAIEESLDLQIARRVVEAAQHALGMARPMGFLKDAGIGITAERELEGGSQSNPKAKRASEVVNTALWGDGVGGVSERNDDFSEDTPPAWSLGPAFSIGIPLFDQGQAEVGSAQARWQQAVERQAALDIRIRTQVHSRFIACQAARERALHAEQVLLPLRRRIVDATQLQYNAMQVGTFQLLQAKRDEINAGAQYIEALHAYWVARARLDQITCGRLGPTSPGDFGASFAGPSSAFAANGGGHGGD